MLKTLITICVSLMLHGLALAQGTDTIKSIGYTWMYIIDDLDYHFYHAQTSFLNMQYEESSREVRKAATYVMMQRRHVKPQHQPALEKAANQLLRLADKIESGKATIFDMELAFANAHYELSSQHYAMALTLWAADKSKQAGKAMEASAKHFAYAARWSGRKMKSGSKITWKGVREIAAGLKKGAIQSKDRVAFALDFLGSELKELHKRVNSDPDVDW